MNFVLTGDRVIKIEVIINSYTSAENLLIQSVYWNLVNSTSLTILLKPNYYCLVQFASRKIV